MENNNFTENAVAIGHQTTHNHHDIEAIKESSHEAIEALKSINLFLTQENASLKIEINLLKTKINNTDNSDN